MTQCNHVHCSASVELMVRFPAGRVAGYCRECWEGLDDYLKDGAEVQEQVDAGQERL